MNVLKKNYYMFAKSSVIKFSLIAAILFCQTQLSFAQQTFIQNESQAELGSPALGPSAASVDSKGNQYNYVIDPSSGETQSVIPVSNAVNLNGVGGYLAGSGLGTTDTAETASTTTVIVATTHAARAGDYLYFTAGTAGNIGVWAPVASVATNSITLANALPATPANGDAFIIFRPQPLSRPEDSAAASGDPLVGVASVRNANFATPAAEGDYQYIASGTFGNVLTSIVQDGNIAVSQTPVRLEDSAFADTNPVIMAGAVNNRSATVFNSTNGDVTPIGVLDDGAVLSRPVPSGAMVVGCNTAITTATTGQMIAATASNFTFITSWSCTNTGGAASRVILEDGDGTDLANLLLAATTGNASVTFPTPVRTNAVNKAIQVNVITTGTSTICCASGYISTI